ncbi:hypothetical protein SDC9_63145 [bioreactor metagenome]|uniref:HYR domain-containing protein n=1 Tax=bioreactor metagenome TaxID=1076179 RepID=A0A644XR85_9ZZZZ
MLYYLVQVSNNGNVYDKFSLSVYNHACNGLDFDPLNSRLLDLDGNEITETPWISPFNTYQFLIELVAPIGSNPFHFSCHDLTASSVVNPGVSDVGTTQTEILGSPKYPLVNISKIESKDPVERGELYTYTIFVFNSNDKYPALNFKFYENYDPSIEFVSAVPAPDAGTNNVWSLGSLGYGLDSAKTIFVTVRVVDDPVCSGLITNTVECSYTNQNKYPTATAYTTILGHPDLVVTKSVVTVPTPAVIGGDLYYTLKYKNIGNCVADNVVLKDFFDNSHLNPLSLAGGVVSGGVIQWNLNTLNPGDSGQIIYSMMIDPAASFNPGVTLIRNYVNISTSVTESDYNNNNAMAVVSLTLLPDLKIHKTNPDTLLVGVPYTYTITVENIGDHNASDISLADVLPSTLQFVSASDGGSISAGKITWPTVSSLNANASFSRSVTVIPLCTAIPSVVNEANASCVTIELNYSNNYIAVQSVVVDEEIPEILCIDSQKVVTNSGCTYVVSNTDWDAAASDNCDVSDVSYVISGATTGSGTSLNGVAFSVGVSTVTWTVTDKSGNTASCSFTVEVTDAEPPVFVTCQDGNEFTLPTDSGYNTYTHVSTGWDAVASDNCGIDSLFYTLNGATSGTGESLDGVVFNLGNTVVVWTAIDNSGNESTCSFTVIVNDEESPDFSFCLSGNNQSVNTDPSVNTYTQPDNSWDATASDNNGIASLTYELSGVTTGNGTSLAGVAFNIGTTTVTFTAVDSSGNESVCTFDVIVSDNEFPVFSFCLSGNDQSVNTDPGASTYTQPDNSWDATASDNNGIASLAYELTGATTGSGTSLAGVAFNIGTTTITYTAVDSSGNISFCIFDVIVSDNENPVFSFCLSGNDQSVNTDPGFSTYTQPDNSWDATASDNNGIASLTYKLSGATSGSGTSLAGVAFNIGTTTVTYTAVDSSGNESVCIFDVIVSDIEFPVFSFCLSGNDQSVNTDVGADTYTQPDSSWDATVTDNDGIAGLTYELTGATTGSGESLAGVVFNIGTTTVTYTAVDSSGNISVCTFDVIVSDNEFPVFSFCLSGNNQVVRTDDGANTYTQPDNSWDATASDNNGIASLTYELTGATNGSGTSLAGVAFNIGTTTVTYTAVDSSGNISKCIFDVIVSDNEDPVFTFCLGGSDQEVSTDPGANTYTHSGAGWDATATDNNGIASLTYELSGATTGSGVTLDGVVFALGTTTVVWTAIDLAGNISLCVYQVTVVDNEEPEIECPANLNFCSIDEIEIGTATATDNVGVVSITNNAPAVFPVGTTVVTWVATDAQGNSDSCEQIIVVTQISSVFAGKDAEFCQGTTSYTFNDAEAGNYKYLTWSVESGSGSFDDPSILNATYLPPVNESGTVTLKLVAYSNGTCPETSDIVNLRLFEKPVISAIEPDAICSGETTGLSVTGASYYWWSPGNMEGSFVEVSPMESTIYTVVGTTKEGCQDTTLINLTVKPSPDVTLTASAYEVNIGDEVYLQANGADFYYWNLEELNADHGSLIITENTIVDVLGIAGNGCTDRDTVEIRILGYHNLFIPEGYSPNADGIHDHFDIIGIDAYPSNVLKIYNRWGSLVYVSKGYHNEWDGFSNSDLINGKTKLPEGTYYYILDLGDGSQLLSGSVYISR